MSEAITIAIISGAAPTIAVVIGAILNWITLRQIQKTTAETHKMVNGQHSAMKVLVSELRDRIADDNPKDGMAQAAASIAAGDVTRDKASSVSLPEA